MNVQMISSKDTNITLLESLDTYEDWYILERPNSVHSLLSLL